MSFTATGFVGQGTAYENVRCSCGHIRAHHDLHKCLVDDCGTDCNLVNCSSEEKEQTP